MKTGAVLVAGWILLSASVWLPKRWPEVTKEELHGIKVKY